MDLRANKAIIKGESGEIFVRELFRSCREQIASLWCLSEQVRENVRTVKLDSFFVANEKCDFAGA
jgi:hypothetical protein